MAEVAVLKALLSPLAKLFFDKMASGELMDFFRGRKSTAKLLKQLEIELLSVSAVLEDAEDKQVTHPDVKKWFNELKDAMYDAEDLLDKIATEALERMLDAELQGTAITKVRNGISTSVNLFVKGIDSEIKELLETLEFLAKQKDIIGLRAGVGEKLPKSLPTTSPVEESSVFGRDNDREMIINLLLSDCGRGNEMSVIAIVGMGGIGKTTLAQLVYNDSRVRLHFNLQAWFCVSEEFDESTIKKSIIEAVTKLPCDIRDPDQIQVTLQEKLKDKFFLLVLDDVWTENPVHQKFLNELLRYGVRGSKIIITTRNESVVAAMHVIAIHPLDELSEESCWSLFRKHAFHDDTSITTPHPELEELCQNIVKKCQGLPLAIKAIGDLLRSERDIKKWDKILKSELWDFPIDKTYILPALRLSYMYLPSHLKRCFSYCSIFPKDYGFEKDQLVLMWMGEGFLHQSNIETMEEIGDRYFLALVSRSLFQQSGDDKLHFRMHDLVHDLAKSVAGQFSFMLEGHSSHELVKRTRHLSFSCASLGKFEKIDESLYQAKQLRTFVALDSSSWASEALREDVFHNLIRRLRCLRVLSLSNNRDITNLPNSIGEIKHLRYLDFSFTRIKRLPDSICKLHNLQTLKLLGCGYLVALPRDLWRLIHLRHLDIAETGIKEMPTKLGSLKCLQTLTAFVIGKGSGSSIRELRNLNDIRGTLSLLQLQNVVPPKDAKNAGLEDKKYLEMLVLEWDGTTQRSHSERTVLEHLRPHTSLKSLSIKGYGGGIFPDWVGDYQSFCNITSLHLRECKCIRSLPPFGQLCSLRELSIVSLDGIVTVGREFYGSSTGSNSIQPFKCLEVLRFEKMLGWEEWISFSSAENEGETFPHLKELCIKNCPKLKEGLPIHIPSLAKLEIDSCPKLVASLLRSKSEEMPKDVRILLQELPNGRRKLEVKRANEVASLNGIMDSNNGLQELEIDQCSSLMSFPWGGGTSSEKSVRISESRNLELPVDTNSSSLETLWLWDSCDSLRSFPLELFPKLQHLTFYDCRNLECLAVPEHDDRDLVISNIHIRYCNKFASFPKGGLRAPNLTSLDVNRCKSLTLLPDKMYQLLPSLLTLRIAYCPQMESFPEGGLPSNLNSLAIWRCEKLTANRMGWGLQNLSSLTTFEISGESEGVKSFPEAGLLPTGLIDLRINHFRDLKSLDKNGFQHLTFLGNLYIDGCKELEQMPEKGLPASLSSLEIHGCPLLKKQWKRKRGKGWLKIAHIPNIKIDWESIQNLNV